MENEEEIASVVIEQDTKKLQNLAILVDRIMREEIKKASIECSFFEARVCNIKTVGVQGDEKTYSYPAEITIEDPRYCDGRNLSESEFNGFLAKLGTRVPNEIKEINRVVYVLADKKMHSS
jgi:GMP synthase PP-ATPase subunit